MKKDKESENNIKENQKTCECDEKKCEHSNENKDDCTENPDESQKRIEALEDEVKSLKDTLLRKIAEMDNLRKRLEKERDEVEKYANSRFAKDLLSVIDNFDRVFENSGSTSEKMNEGVNMKAVLDGVLICGKELTSALKKHGISQIEVAEGDQFDPRYHQAMCEIESKEHKPGSVIKVFQIGYVYHDRLLRPSMVSVSKKTQ